MANIPYTGQNDKTMIGKEATYGTPDKGAAKAISNITAADPGVITCAAHGLTTAKKHLIYISGITLHADMKALNDRWYMATATTATTLTLDEIDTSAFGGVGTDGNVYSCGGSADHSHLEQEINLMNVTVSIDPKIEELMRIGDGRTLQCMIDGVPHVSGTITGQVVGPKILKVGLQDTPTAEAGNAYTYDDIRNVTGDVSLAGHTIYTQISGNEFVVMTGCKFGIARITSGLDRPLQIELEFIAQNIYRGEGALLGQIKPEGGTTGTCQPLMFWNGEFEYNNVDYILDDFTLTINNNLTPEKVIEDTVSGRMYAALTEGNLEVILDGSVKVENAATLFTEMGFGDTGILTTPRTARLIEIDFTSTVAAANDRTALFDIRNAKLTMNEVNPRGDIETRYFRLSARAEDIQITGAYI